MDMSRMIFVTGFARGGTSWLRDCIAFHPQVQKIPREMVVFKDHGTGRDAIVGPIAAAIEESELQGPYFVNKAPANAPFIAPVCRMFPESKFIFIIRDPRDVFISHKRGNQKWMGGENSTVDGCMKKTRHYYEGYLQAADEPNVMLVQYERLHQDFHATIAEVFDFIGLSADEDLINDCYKQNNFWNVASRNIEDRDSARRKGVVGDWVNFLEPKEERWYRSQPFWTDFLSEHGYSWEPPTNERLFEAMQEAGVHWVSEGDLVDCRLDQERLNVLVTQDIDLLDRKALPSVLATAELEAKYGVPGVFYFLPLDDVRYKSFKPKKVVEIINQIRAMSDKFGIGLHLNAAEKHFPADMPDLGNDHPDIAKAIASMHSHIEAYATHGIEFRTATAHGYGRRKKLPNNRDTPVFTEELAARGIRIWDNDLRPKIFDAAAHVTHFADVGGALAMRGMPNNGSPTDPTTYCSFPPGSLVHLLLHPGNYDVHRPLSLGVRRNLLGRTDISAKVSV